MSTYQSNVERLRDKVGELASYIALRLRGQDFEWRGNRTKEREAIERLMREALAAPGSAPLTPYGEELLKLKQGHFCGNCGADLSKHPVSASAHVCPIAEAEKRSEDERVCCMQCGKSVSTPVPKGTIVRAWVECPECIEKHAAEPPASQRPPAQHGNEGETK